MDKERQAVKAKYDEEVRINEQGFSELTKQKRELDEKRAVQATAKKEITLYLDNTFNELRGKDMANELRELEKFKATVEHENRLAEQKYEQEHVEIEKRRKKLQMQKEEAKTKYRRALS